MIGKDKIKHYNVAYKFARYGSVFGFVLVIFLAAGKEVHDYFNPNHCCEWQDFVWSCKGALDGVLFKPNRFTNE